jgi:hypothetical protein
MNHNLVGNQKFTYEELETAWEELNRCVDFGYIYDIRNGYSITESKDCNENEWYAEWNFDSLCKAVESVKGIITFGDLEVYWNHHGEADSDGHGIIIVDGMIDRVY